MQQDNNPTRTVTEAEADAHRAFQALNTAANELIIGQQRLMERLLIALLSLSLIHI